MKIKNIFITLLCLTSYYTYGQDSITALKVGDKIPQIALNNMINGKSTMGNLSDYKGKLVIIDFWATWCVPCLRVMPDLDALQQHLGKDIQILAVTDEKNDKVKKFMQTLPSLKQLSLPIVTEDITLNKLFPHLGIPYEVIIDKNGIVKAFTTPSELNQDNVTALIKGQSPGLYESKSKFNFNYEKPFFIKDEGQDLQFHFLITGYLDGLLGQDVRRGKTKLHGDTRIASTNISILDMYKEAYFERLGPEFFGNNRFILEVKDSSRFITPRHVPDNVFYKWGSKNLYCFDVGVPDRLAGHKLYSIFKNGLDSFFSLDSKKEVREVNCYVLKSLDTTKYKSALKTPINDRSKKLWTINNEKIDRLVIYMNYELNKPLIDETGFSGLADISFNPDFSDMKKIKKRFREMGLDLVEENRNIDMIVLKDK